MAIKGPLLEDRVNKRLVSRDAMVQEVEKLFIQHIGSYHLSISNFFCLPKLLTYDLFVI